MADDNNKNEAAEIKSLIVGVDKAVDTVRELAEKGIAEAKTAGGMATETKAKVDEVLTEFNTKAAELNGRLLEIEQKAARRGPVAAEHKSLGEMIVENDAVKALLASPTKRGNVAISLETKAILSASTTWGATTSAATNALVRPDVQGMFALPMRQMTVRDLLAQGETASNAIEYAVQTAFTNNAAVVAENTTKPVSDMTFDLRAAAVRTIAHTSFASRQILDDAPMLRTFINSQMRYGVEYAEEAEILYGDGTGQHLLGIVPQAATYAAPFAVTGETNLDRLRLATLQAQLALLPPSGYVLNPLDLARVEMVKDGMGRYIVGDPQGTMQPRLWNLPVVPSMALTAGTFLVGAFRTAAQIFDRMAIEILISTEDQDNFRKNMVTIRAEERLALAVYRPTAFITGALVP